ncbi:MAG: hypothetical protein EAY75_05375, partial [Bacteroidetes bacterium]
MVKKASQICGYRLPDDFSLNVIFYLKLAFKGLQTQKNIHMNNRKTLLGLLAAVAAAWGLCAFSKTDKGKAVVARTKNSAADWLRKMEALFAKAT